MEDDLSIFEVLHLPPFIHEIPEMRGKTANPQDLFNFWAPERSGNPARDEATGRQHFDTAMAFGRIGHQGALLAHIVGGMCTVGAGPMERGFLSVLSTKATYGRLPPLITPDMAELTCRLSGRPESEIRFGESEAREYLDIARELRCPEIIKEFMIDIVDRRMGNGALTFMWTVCGAAYQGAAN